MPHRELVPISYRGIGLQGKGLTTYFDFDDGGFDVAEHEPILVERIGSFPSRVLTQPQEKVLPLHVVLTSGDTEGMAAYLAQIFDPLLGPQPLIVRDADGVLKSVTCEPRRIIYDGSKQNDRSLVIPLVAARPLLEANTLKAVTQTGDDFSLHNQGSYHATPTIRALGTQLKAPTAGPRFMREIDYAWRSTMPAVGPASGTWLLELTGGWNTTTVIDVSGTATTLDQVGGILIGTPAPFVITVASAAAFGSVGEDVMLLITAGGLEEQFIARIASGTTFTILARAVGGQVARAHLDGATIHLSHMMLDGRDIKVFVDEVEVPPEKVTIDNIDKTTTKIWIEIADAPGHSAALTDEHEGLTSSTAFVFRDSDHGFAVGEYAILEDTVAGFEQVRISAIDGRNLTLTRGVRNSTPISPATVTLWRAGHHIQIAYYFANTTEVVERPTNPDPPLIDTDLSDNTVWHWTTSPVWADGNRRPGGWRRTLYVGDAANASRLSASIGLDADSGNVRWTDTEPTADKPNFDAIEFGAQCGIDVGATDIEWDGFLAWNLALEVIGRDLLGLDHLISRRHGHESGDGFHGVEAGSSLDYTARNEQTDQVLSALIFRCRNLVVTSSPVGDVDEALGGNAADSAGVDFQVFTLDQDTRIHDVVVRTRRVDVTDKTVRAAIRTLVSGDPAPVDSDILVSPSDWQGIAASAFAVTFGNLCFYIDVIPEHVLPAGSYALEYRLDGGSTSIINWARTLSPQYSRGNHWQMVGGPASAVAPAEDMWFGIMSADVDNQPEVLGGTEEEVIISNLEVNFDSDRTPLVNFNAEEDAYYYDNTITRGSQSMRFRFLQAFDRVAQITIDVLNKTVESAEFSSPADAIRQTLAPNDDDWITFPPGLFALTIIPQTTAILEDNTVEFRDTWS